MLLVDSDEAVTANQTAREFLQEKHQKWNLQKVAGERCHLMLQIMESWFLADIDALKTFYGKEFKTNAIPKHKNVETIAKETVEKSLAAAATVKTQKAERHKIEHGAKILEIIDSREVREAAPHCRELFKKISEQIHE